MMRQFQMFDEARGLDIIGVQQHELGVLRGAEGTLTGDHPPKLFLELHSEIIRRMHGEPKIVLDLLKSWGYECYDVHSKPYAEADILGTDVTRLYAVRANADSR